MKKSIALLIGIALILLGTLTRGNWIIGLKLLCAIFLVMLVLYWKIAPFKQQLFPKYQKAFGITERIFMRLQNILGFIPKIQMGQRLQLDTSLIVCIFFYAFDISCFVKTLTVSTKLDKSELIIWQGRKS